MIGSRKTSEINDDVAERIARFKSVFVPYPRHVELHGRLDYLQRLGTKTKGKAQMGLRVLGPTGSGKTTAADAYIARVEAQRPRRPDFIPIIKVDLERHSTPKKLLTSILLKCGDPYSGHGNELTLKRRVMEFLSRLQTELLMVDEVQHLNYRNGVRNDVTDTLKGLLDAGIVPIVFLGTDEAEDMFRRNLQLNGRLLPPCDLHRLSVARLGDRDLFSRFVRKLEEVVVEQDVLPELSELEATGVLPALWEVSDGVIGRVSRLFHVAIEFAVRRDAERLDVRDFSLAIERWAIEQAFIETNPLARAPYV